MGEGAEGRAVGGGGGQGELRKRLIEGSMGGQKEGTALSPCLSWSLMEQLSLAFSVKIGWGWMGFRANSARCQAGLGVASASPGCLYPAPEKRASSVAPSRSLHQCVSWMRTLIPHTPVQANNSHGGHSKATTLLSHACFKFTYFYPYTNPSML